MTRQVHPPEWSRALGKLRAPLGYSPFSGNHDGGTTLGAAARPRSGPGRTALEAVGIRVLENDAVRLSRAGAPFWLAGLADQLALLPGRNWGREHMTGLDDLPGTLAKIDDDAPSSCWRMSRTFFRKSHKGCPDMSGIRMGGRCEFSAIAGGAVAVWPALCLWARCGKRARPDRSGGLGCSIAPVRFGVRPEINLVEVSSESRA
jgi:hypothetical protein